MGKSCVVAVVQAEVAPDRGDGLAWPAQLAHAAARSGVELIVFPERGSSGTMTRPDGNTIWTSHGPRRDRDVPH